MATEIPNNTEKIDYSINYTGVPPSESLFYKMGGSLNYALDLSGFDLFYNQFTSSGSWLCPENVNFVFLFGAGGGGGGQGGRAGSSVGGSGGMGSIPFLWPAFTTPGVNYSITIGSGGAGGAILSNGSNGGDTSFGSLHKYLGGKGGGVVSYVVSQSSSWSATRPYVITHLNKKNFYESLGGNLNGSFVSSNPYVTNILDKKTGYDFGIYTGGASGAGAPAAGGGGASLGNGGNGSLGSSPATDGSGFGSGGGAGVSNFVHSSGANGAPGVLEIFYFKRTI